MFSPCRSAAPRPGKGGFYRWPNGRCPRRSGSLWASRAGKSPCGTPAGPGPLGRFSGRITSGGSCFAGSHALRPPFFRLPGRVCARVGGGVPDLCPAALRRRRAPEKGRWRGLTRVPARMLPYPLPAPRPETARPRATAGEKARSGPRGAVSADVKSAVREGCADKLRPRAGLLPHVPAYERKRCKFNLCKAKLHNMNCARSQTKFDEKTCMKRECTLHRRNWN